MLQWYVRRGETDDKLIGVYATRGDAERAQARAVLLNGFRDAPDGFVIDAYVLGEDHWETGYVTVVTSSENPAEAQS